MATIVSQVMSGVKATVASTLGASYRELRFVYDVTKNDLRSARLAYGVRPLSAGIAEDNLLRMYTLNHGFEIVLTDTLARDGEDTEKNTALMTMYSQADEIFKALVNTKAGVPAYVVVVNQPTLSEPEFIDDNEIIVLRMQLNIRYRSAL